MPRIDRFIIAALVTAERAHQPALGFEEDPR